MNYFLANAMFVRRAMRPLLLAISATFLYACGGDGTTDLVSPTVVDRSPGDLEVNVPLAATVQVVFSEQVDPTTIVGLAPGSETIRLVEGETVVPGTVFYNNSNFTATFTPDDDLNPNTQYQVQIFGEITDTTGNAFDFDNLFASSDLGASSFTTQEIEPPIVIDTDPNEGTNTGSITENIVVEFSEALDPATVNASSVTVMDESGSVSGDVSFVINTVVEAAEGVDEVNTFTAVFDPDVNLSFGTEYTVTLSTEITDSVGNPFNDGDLDGVGDGPLDFRFTTMQEPGLDDFGFTATDPAADARDVEVTSDITVTFDENVDVLTVIDSSFNVFEAGAFNANADTMILGMVAAVDATTATFTPNGCLPTDSRIIGALFSDIANVAGGNLIPGEFEFLTTSGWNQEERIDDLDGLPATGITLASDGADRVMALWIQDDPAGAGASDLLASFFDVAACAWSDPEVVDNSMGAAANPNVGSGTDGAFLATWEQDSDIFFSVFDPDPAALTWSAPALIDPDAPEDLPGPALFSTLSVTSAGNALAVWLESPTPAAAGGGAAGGGGMAGGGAAGGGMAAGGGGGGAAPADDSDVRASFYDPDTGVWSDTLQVNDLSGLIIDGLDADLDIAGNAIVLYEQNILDDELDLDDDPATGEEDEVVISQFDPNSAVWSDSVALDFDQSDAVQVIVEIDDTSGDAILVWVQDNAVVAMGPVQELRAVALPLGADPLSLDRAEAQFGFDGNPAEVAAIIGPSIDDALMSNAFIVAVDPGAMGMAGAPNGQTRIQAVAVGSDVFEGTTLASELTASIIGFGEAATDEAPNALTVVEDLTLTFDAAGNPVATWEVEDIVEGTVDGAPVQVFDFSTIVTNTFIDGSWGFPIDVLDPVALTIVSEQAFEQADIEIISGTGVGEILVRLQDDGSDVDQVIGIRNGDNAE